MRKHPLLAFAATTLGLGLGASTIGATGASASPARHHHAHQHTHLDKTARRIRHHARAHSSHGTHKVHRRSAAFLVPVGPTRFLLPDATGSRPSASPTSGKVWQLLRMCESGGNYQENSGNGYYGAYQFAISSWHSIGESGMPNLAPPAVQDAAAFRLMTIQGWRAWPNCSWLLGLA